jgi:hypothetical protein
MSSLLGGRTLSAALIVTLSGIAGILLLQKRILGPRLHPHGTVAKTYIMARLTQLICCEPYRKAMWWICHILRRKHVDIVHVRPPSTIKLGLVFICADDPHSFVLLQCLQKFTAIYSLCLRVVVLPVGVKAWSTDATNQIQWALKDSERFCQLYDLEAPKGDPDKQTPEMFTRITADLLRACKVHKQEDPGSSSWEDISSERVAACIEILRHIWAPTATYTQHDSSSVLSKQQLNELKSNDALLRSAGYYGPGVIEVEGEVYTSSRLHHLERRLKSYPNDVRSADMDSSLLFCKEMESLGRTTPYPIGLEIPSSRTPMKNPCAHVIMYYSFRSPYSQLAITRMRKLCAYHNAVFSVRCLMPMVMRGT